MTLAQHMRATCHAIDFDSIKVTAHIEQMIGRIIREAIKTEDRFKNLNTRRQPTAWKPLMNRTKNLILTSGASLISGPITSNHVRNN